ncbi:TetR/AcrR family transcriptional regulator [Parvularcula marina]|uniref:TetR/AcrR family transcriptional regulator n=1 Tax=Parvularcula marina TaxID=2292771 RepID=A0A371RKZ7_9PROT|nr:TetR/AcrR family transcriptional regulator [Parvularcula marina]RFB06133.1 TetR/AcrR family transcriptional regulator [Parvularcula marina]
MGKSSLMTAEPVTRQDQVLQAAARCFVEEGFHGASMSRIAKAAGMSPGHIYHYFESKEAIISDIVRREEIDARAFFDQFRECSPSELISNLMSCVEEGVQSNTDTFHSVLMLEILAEAARSSKVMTIVQEVDKELRDNFANTLKERLDLEDAHGRVEVMFALFTGLAIRIIRNPGLDRTRITHHMRQVLSNLLTQSNEDEREHLSVASNA